MTVHEFWWTLIIGIVIGWQTHGIIMQIAYYRGIIEYKGTKHDKQRLP